jgi:hypothetical protein
MAEPKEVEQLCGEFPSYLPKDKAARVITVAPPMGCPCGGTHVKVNTLLVSLANNYDRTRKILDQ